MATSKKTKAAPVAEPEVTMTMIETQPTEPSARKRRTKVVADALSVEPVRDATPEPSVATAHSAVTPKPKRKAKATPTRTTTLATVFAGYLQSLDERGGSTGTITSYRMELDMAGKALGIDTPLTALTDTQVAAYFESDPVICKRSGKPKSPLSIDKTRRVLRQALAWAGHADLVPSAEVAS